MKTQQVLIIAVALGAIVAASWSMWRQVFAPPVYNVALHQGIGQAMAEQTMSVVNGQGRITVVTMDAGDSPIVAAQFNAFLKALKESGAIHIEKQVVIRSEKADSYGPGYGLSARKLAREVQKNPDVDAFVSFVGLPWLDEEEITELGPSVPAMIATARDGRKLGTLAEHGILRAAVVPRFQFPAPGPEHPGSPQEWFDSHYQVVVPRPEE